MFRPQEIGVDVGAATVSICVKGKGIVLREPSVVALVRETGEVRAVGDEAYRLLGQTPGGVVPVRPLRDGVVADYALTEKMLGGFLRRVVTGPGRLWGVSVMMSVPPGVSETEKRMMLGAVKGAEVRKVRLIEAPLAAAIGAGLSVTGPTGVMVVDVGGGTTDVAVISLGGVVVAESLRVAGGEFDEAVVRFLRHKENMLIGDRTAEEVRLRVGAASVKRPDEVTSFEVRGRDLASGSPKNAVVTTDDVASALRDPLEKIAAAVQRVLETAPRELAADIINQGIVLTGGGASLKNLDDLLHQATGVPVVVAEHAADCAALGAAAALGMTELLAGGLISDTTSRL